MRKEHYKIGIDWAKDANFTVMIDPNKTVPVWPCGCLEDEPHSHLIAGASCECEKGRPKQSLTPKG